MKRVLVLLLSVMSGAAVAQTTGTVTPGPAPAQPSVSQDVPPGGCMPIGLTASGEIVFPIQCKALIEQHRGKDVNPSPAVVEQRPAAVEQKPASVEQKPATVEQKPAAGEEKAAARQSETVAPENSQPANKPAETAALQKRVEQDPRERACQHFRSYDAVSGTYTGYDGQRHPCR